jgi:hypothetical protein
MTKTSRVWSAERSGKNVREDAKRAIRASNTMWSMAPKAQLFQRKPKFVGVGKDRKRATMMRRGEEVDVPVRANRAVRKLVVKVLFSAAAQNAARVLASEADELSIECAGEASVAPALPRLSKGAELMFEQALIAYTQSIFDGARRVKDAFHMHSKVTSGAMAAAAAATNERLFGGVGMAVPEEMPLPARKIVRRRSKPEPKKAGAEVEATE